MLRRILIASAAAAMLLVTFTPDDAFARGGMRAGAVRCEREVTAAARSQFEDTAAALSQFEDTGAALSLCAAGRYGAIGGYRYGVGAAAVGAAAVGAAAAGAYYRGGCGYDAYGNWVCPNGYYPY